MDVGSVGYSAMKRNIAAVIAIAGILALSACTQAPHATSTSGKALSTIETVADGAVGGTKWRVDLVRDGSKLCTVAVVEGKERSKGCNPPVDSKLVVNFAVDNPTEGITIVYGVAGPEVSTLSIKLREVTQPFPVTLLTTPADRLRRYFAYAAKPNSAEDLTAKDVSGNVIFSGASKFSNGEVDGIR